MSTLDVGAKCAVILPQKFINPQITPALGLVIKKLVDCRSLVLIEEVWQFKGLSNAPLQEMCFSTGALKQERWGWQEVPSLIDNGLFWTVPAEPYNIMFPSPRNLTAMIKKSVIDFKEIHGFV